MSELEALKKAAKETGKKPSKELIKAAKGIDKMREIIAKAGIDPLKSYMDDKYGKGNW